MNISQPNLRSEKFYDDDDDDDDDDDKKIPIIFSFLLLRKSGCMLSSNSISTGISRAASWPSTEFTLLSQLLCEAGS